jgi:uroporphyrinogen III methyltransferase/synthase
MKIGREGGTDLRPGSRLPIGSGGGRPRVLVTRAREQARDLCDLLLAAGLEPVCFPTIALRPVEDTAALDAAIARLERYDWIVFASSNAVRFFVERLRALGRPPEVCGGSRVVAGPATSAVLREYGICPTIVPSPFSAEAALSAMEQGVKRDSRVLLPRAEGGRDLLAGALRARGALVDEVVLYRTGPAAEGAAEVARQFAEGAFAAITFFSPSAVRGFAALGGASSSSEPPVPSSGFREAAGHEAIGHGSTRVQDLLHGVVVACIGPTTAAAAGELDWRVDVIPPDTTAASLVDVLVRQLAAQSASIPDRQSTIHRRSVGVGR